MAKLPQGSTLLTESIRALISKEGAKRGHNGVLQKKRILGLDEYGHGDLSHKECKRPEMLTPLGHEVEMLLYEHPPRAEKAVKQSYRDY